MTLSSVAENSVLVSFGDTIDPALTPRIAAFCETAEAELGSVIIDLVPSYTTVLCTYDVAIIDFRRMERRLHEILTDLDNRPLTAQLDFQRHHLPVFYHPDVGPDLPALADYARLSVAEVIQRHTAVDYQVFAIGFSPGFGFLGEVDPVLAAPRHASPRTHVAAGSVAIANRQTAVYPLASPGGWQLIGRSPAKMFDSHSLSRLKVGDRVRFYEVDRACFLELGGEI